LNYRPPLATPKPQAQPCIAAVTGPAGEEIYTDQYGRVKVQFKWDRVGKSDEKSSAWIRPTSPWAGANGRGMIFLPRIGDEVLVSFIEGDPDQPVITGSLYNANNLPPYTLPDNKTQSGIKSLSSKGGGGANELRFEDLKGSEQVYLNATKDLVVNAANNATLSVGNTLNFSASGSATLSAGTSLNLQAGTQTTITGPISAGALQATSINVQNLTANTESVINGMNVDQNNLNSGSVSANALTFGNGSGEGIASKRTAGGNQYDLEFYTGFNNRMIILNNGAVGIGEANPAGALHITGPINTPPPSQPSGDNGLVLGTTGISTYKWIQSYGGSLILNPTGNNVGIGNTSPTHLLVVGSAGSPAYCDGTTWQNGSDRGSKEAFASINPGDVLEKVSVLPITEWRYKTETNGTEHLGPMAQDFHAAFGLNGSDDKHISTVDEGGVALAAIQGLNEKVEGRSQEADQRIRKLEVENQQLRQSLAELKATVSRLIQPKSN
jgi:phage baseplate assembly protein gpV